MLQKSRPFPALNSFATCRFRAAATMIVRRRHNRKFRSAYIGVDRVHGSPLSLFQRV